jgi:hypothetical protein
MMNGPAAVNYPTRFETMQTDSVKWTGVLGRIVAALLLVFATWNPDGMSYWHWAIQPVSASGLSSLGPLKVLAGIVLLIGWFIALKATRQSLGVVGAVLTVALVGCIIWLLIDWHVVSARSSRGIARLVLFVVGVMLGVGLSWSLLRGRLTGQISTDEVR